MDKPNKELLQAFIDWFMREYSNFGGKPIAERYEEAFDTFNNDFIDARYDAFQDGWKVQQAKVEELQVQLKGAQERAQLVLQYKDKYRLERDELQKRVDSIREVLEELQEQADVIRKRGQKFRDSSFLASADMMDICIKEIEQALKGEG